MSAKTYIMVFLSVLVASITIVGDEGSASVIIKGTPKSVEPIVSGSTSYSYLVRVNTVHKLPDGLSSAEADAILKFLGARYTDEWNFMTPMEFNAIKNEAVIALAKQRTDCAPALSNMMQEMYSDKSYDEMWRNYCVQFMGTLYSRMDATQREKSLKLLWEAMKESNTCIPGAALLSLTRIAATDSTAVDKKQLAQSAYEVLTHKDALEINQTTALQTCAQFGYTQALPVARCILSDPHAPIPLKMSAVAALGYFGDSSDLSTLESISKSTDTRLRTAALSAIAKLKNNSFMN